MLLAHFIKDFAPKFVGATASQIGDIIEKILMEIQFQSHLWISKILEKEDIQKIFSKLHINLNQLEKQNQDIKKWYESVVNTQERE